MKKLLCIFSLLLSFQSYGQVLAWHDSTNCASVTVDLHATITGDIPTSAGITSDDGYSGLIPIGFTFNFYGTNYTQCVIGSNGMISFNPALAGAYCPWPISAVLLGNASARNSICGPWCDIFIPSGGTITYSTSGVAPNRRFSVSYCATRMYSCTTQWITTQIILYETSNIVETHTGHKTICAWNGGYAIIGVQNAAGTSATVAPGRDYPAVYNLNNEAWRFTPVGTTTFTVGSIPHAPIPYASSAIYWYDSTTGAYLGTGPTITVAPAVNTTYMAVALGCDDSTRGYVHVKALMGLTGTGQQDTITGYTAVGPTICGQCNGTIVLKGLDPGHSDTVVYAFNGVRQPNIITTAAADSTITLTGLCEGTYDYLIVKVGNCPSNQVGPVVFTTPPLVVGYDTLVKFGCFGDEVKFFNLSTPTGAAYTSLWDFGDGSPTSTEPNPVHVYTAQGVYTVRFTHGTIYGCRSVAVFTLTLLHPIDAVFTTDASEVCLGTPINFTNTSTSNSQLTYKWNFGNGIYDTATSPSYTYPMQGTYTARLTITDTIGCQDDTTATLMVAYIDIRTSTPDTSVCLKDSMSLHAIVVDVYPDTLQTIGYNWVQEPGTGNYLGDPTAKEPKFYSLGHYKYTVTGTSAYLGCKDADTVAVHSYPPLVLANVTTSLTIPYGGSVQLNADSAIYYRWTPNNGTLDNDNINNPIATPVDSETVYTVYGMNLWGCETSATVKVRLDYGMNEAIPSAFTPNGDGLNDIFRLTKLKYQKVVDFSVFNRWGQRVFQTANGNTGWDGTWNGVAQDLGTYNYQVIIANPEGENKVYTGTVTLIR